MFNQFMTPRIPAMFCPLIGYLYHEKSYLKVIFFKVIVKKMLKLTFARIWSLNHTYGS